MRQTDVPAALAPEERFRWPESVAPQATAALGAEALAQVLVAHADTDPVLRKTRVMLLTSTARPGKLGGIRHHVDHAAGTEVAMRSFDSDEYCPPWALTGRLMSALRNV